MEPLLLRADEAAKLLQLSRSKVYAMLQTGELPCVRIGRSVRIAQNSLMAWVAERSPVPATTASVLVPTVDGPPEPSGGDLETLFRMAGFGRLGRRFTAEQAAPALRRLAEGLRSADPLLRHMAHEEAVRRLTQAGVRTPQTLVRLTLGKPPKAAKRLAVKAEPL
jgi:excisionase family DNA binding protein